MQANKTIGDEMKKLIVCHGYYGHVELGVDDKVKNGQFAGLGQREMFEKIMQEGYGKNVPAIFHAEFKNGDIKSFQGDKAKELIDNPDVEEVTVIAPIVGG